MPSFFHLNRIVSEVDIVCFFFYIKDVAFSEPLRCGGERTIALNIIEFSVFLHFRLLPWRDRSLCSLLLTTVIMK